MSQGAPEVVGIGIGHPVLCNFADERQWPTPIPTTSGANGKLS